MGNQATPPVESVTVPVYDILGIGYGDGTRIWKRSGLAIVPTGTVNYTLQRRHLRDTPTRQHLLSILHLVDLVESWINILEPLDFSDLCFGTSRKFEVSDYLYNLLSPDIVYHFDNFDY